GGVDGLCGGHHSPIQGPASRPYGGAPVTGLTNLLYGVAMPQQHDPACDLSTPKRGCPLSELIPPEPNHSYHLLSLSMRSPRPGCSFIPLYPTGWAFDYAFTPSTASSGVCVRRPSTEAKPAVCNNSAYSASVRSFPSVHTSMLSDCIWTCTGPEWSSFSNFSAMSSAPPAGSAPYIFRRSRAIFSGAQSCRIRPTEYRSASGRSSRKKSPSMKSILSFASDSTTY